MRQKEAVDRREARANVSPKLLKLRMLLLADFESPFEDFLSALMTVRRIVGIAPVANEEEQFLEWRTVCPAFGGEAAVLREQLKMLEVIFLNVLLWEIKAQQFVMTSSEICDFHKVSTGHDKGSSSNGSVLTLCTGNPFHESIDLMLMNQ